MFSTIHQFKKNTCKKYKYATLGKQHNFFQQHKTSGWDFPLGVSSPKISWWFFVLSSAWLLAFRSTSQLPKTRAGNFCCPKAWCATQKNTKRDTLRRCLRWKRKWHPPIKLDMVLKNEMLEALERRKKVGIHTNNGGKMFTQNLTLILLEFLLQKKTVKRIVKVATNIGVLGGSSRLYSMWLITMVSFRPLSRVIPLPNGLNGLSINGSY